MTPTCVQPSAKGCPIGTGSESVPSKYGTPSMAYGLSMPGRQLDALMMS
ncbi:MAG: hypothetical protein UHD09_01230 [Bifidobacterium sp.]|nr:hypothetical protein [Bifidobacterium sp.]